MVLAQLLTEKPLSGAYRERCYEASAGANTWVRFSDADAVWPAWIGIFGNGGVAPYSTAVRFPDDEHVLVIAGGQGFVVHGPSGHLVRKTRWFYSYSAAAVPGRDFIVVADNTEIWAADLRGERSARVVESRFAGATNGRSGQPMPLTDDHYRRIALDGIVFEEVGTDQLSGWAWWWDGWFRFRLTFADWRVVLTGPVASKWDAFQGHAPYGGFPPSPAYQAQIAAYGLR